MDETVTGLRRSDAPSFTESRAWARIKDGWRPLHGSVKDLGYSIEWHDFQNDKEFAWSQSFHSAGLEICLNLAGSGEVSAGSRILSFAPGTAGFYFQNNSELKASRHGKERHRFITVELSWPFVTAHFRADEPGLHPRLAEALATAQPKTFGVSEPSRLTVDLQQVIAALRRPPVFPAAHRLWYQSKALEVASSLLYRPSPGKEFFCERVKRVNSERAQRVSAILKANLTDPPPLQELGRLVGCSQFHLSRIFTQETGKTISAHLRDLRMEKAAQLLLAGEMKITQIALEVGYSSPSHFTTVFRETFDCCPGLYAFRSRKASE